MGRPALSRALQCGRRISIGRARSGRASSGAGGEPEGRSEKGRRGARGSRPHIDVLLSFSRALRHARYYVIRSATSSHRMNKIIRLPNLVSHPSSHEYISRLFRNYVLLLAMSAGRGSATSARATMVELVKQHCTHQRAANTSFICRRIQLHARSRINDNSATIKPAVVATRPSFSFLINFFQSIDVMRARAQSFRIAGRTSLGAINRFYGEEITLVAIGVDICYFYRTF